MTESSTESTVHADAWISIQDLAGELGVSVRTVYGWRSDGRGPRGASFGKYVRFRRVDVDRWIESRLDEPKGA